MKSKLAICAALLALAFGANGDLAAALASPDRSEEDQARDAGRKPAEVLGFLGIGPGMKVMDLIAAGGYYTEVLSRAVGPSGTVYAQNPPAMLAFRDGMYDKALAGRLGGDRLPNVVRLDQDLGEVEVEAGTLDAAITALNLHDVHNGFGGDPAQGPANAAGFLAAVKALLRPGGVLGVVDHYGDSDKDNAQLHRLDVAAAMPILEASGFVIESSDLLRNPEDDRTKMVFEPDVRGKTDRVLYKLTKPAE